MLPWVLEHLTFRSENRFQPVIEALAVIEQLLGTKGQYFPADVPVEGVVLPSWRDTVLEKHDDQVQVNRHYYLTFPIFNFSEHSCTFSVYTT